MKILLFHPVHLPPKDYGGVERVVLWLAKGLRELGHEVTIAALRGSELPSYCRLFEISPESRGDFENIRRMPANIDVVHFMAPPSEETLNELGSRGVASILTVHGNGKKGETFPKNTVFLSQDHARRHGADVFVYNGIDPAEYVFQPQDKKEESFLFLSKTQWSVKNLKGAVQFVKSARVKMKIAGGARPWSIRLRSWIDPSLKWEGPVNGERKAKLLSSARALIFPVLWPEPFGLVVAEALISGTPVLSSHRVSLMVLVDSKVGAICKTEQDWMRWLKADQLPWSSEDCREYAMKKFHYLEMTRKYLDLYAAVISGKSLHSKNPVSEGWSVS